MCSLCNIQDECILPQKKDLHYLLKVLLVCVFSELMKLSDHGVPFEST